MKSGLFLFLLVFTVAVSGHAETTGATSGEVGITPKQEFVENLCVPVCMKLAQVENQAAYNKFKPNCEKAFDNQELLKTWDGQIQYHTDTVKNILGPCAAQAVKKALVDPIVFIISLFTQERQAPIDFNDFLSKCDKSRECRLTMARYIVEYHYIRNDKFLISDEEVYEQVKDMDIHRLYQKSISGKNQLNSYCNQELLKLASAKYAFPRGKSEYQIQKEIYGSLESIDAFCLNILNMPKPIDPSTVKPIPQTPIDQLNIYQKAVVAKACLGDEANEVFQDACSDVMQVVVPIPLLDKLRNTKTSRAAESTKLADDAEVLAREGSESTLSHGEFVQAYKTKVYASEAQNLAFINLANNPPSRNRMFFDVENSAMKPLNDLSKDKDFVTALTNFHKEKMLEQIARLKQKYPNVQFHTYSDFKSIKVAIESSSALTPQMQRQLWDDLNNAFKAANSDFTQEMLRQGVDAAKYGNPETWFRAGIGNTVDEASLAARKARQFRDQVGVLNYNTDRVQGELRNRLNNIETDRQSIIRNPHFRTLLTRSNGQTVPNYHVFELVRKSKTAEELAESISKRYGITFTKADAEQLIKYARGVDELSPTILIAKRENPILDSPHGGISADFLGMGAMNLQGTAAGLAGRNSNLSTSIQQVRAQGMAVTQLFHRRKQRFTEIVGGNVTCTGDDCVKVLERSMTYQEKMNLMNQIARDADTRSVRMSFVAPQVSESYQMALATHGESIEKALRKELEGKISFQKLQQVTFGLDMQSVELNRGVVNLLVGSSSTVRLSAQEHSRIHQAFQQVLQRGYTYNPGVSTMDITTIRLIPNPSVLLNEEE